MYVHSCRNTHGTSNNEQRQIFTWCTVDFATCGSAALHLLLRLESSGLVQFSKRSFAYTSFRKLNKEMETGRTMTEMTENLHRQKAVSFHQRHRSRAGGSAWRVHLRPEGWSRCCEWVVWKQPLPGWQPALWRSLVPGDIKVQDWSGPPLSRPASCAADRAAPVQQHWAAINFINRHI